MRIIFTVLFFLTTISLSAQWFKPASYSMAWNSGHLVFNSGDSVKCLIRYNVAASHSTLQIKDGENVLTISPRDLKSFSFYDSSRSKTRTFTSLKVQSPGNEVFLETLYWDSKFRILNHKTFGIPYEYMEYTRFISRPTLISRKYIFDVSSGKLLPASKENILSLLNSRKDEVAAYIDQHHIKFKRVADYIAVLKYHSSLY
jgi:hypothetical protein